MLALPRSHLHHSESVQCAAWTRSAYGIATRRLAKRIVCVVEVTSKDVLDQSAPSRGWDVLVQDVLPTTARRCDVAVSEFEKCLRVRDIHGLEELVSHGLNELGHACIQYLRACFASGSLGPGQAGTLISGLRRLVLLARSCGADLEDRQSVFRTLWRVHRSWSFAIPAEFRTPVSLEIVLSVGMSAWLHNVPELSLLTLLSYHCRCAQQRPRNFDGATWKLLMDPFEHDTKVYGIVTHQRTRKRAEWQVVQLSNTCFWNVLESVNWTIP